MLRWGLVTLLVVVTAGACESSQAPTTDRLSPGALRTKAAALCEELTTSVDASTPQVGQPPNQVADGLDAIAAQTRATTAQLHDLEPPPDLEGRWDRWIERLDDLGAAIKEAARAVRAGDRPRLQTGLDEASDLASSADSLAGDLELVSCRAPMAVVP